MINSLALTDASNQKPSGLAYILLALFCLMLCAPGFTSIPVTDRDEARFAQSSKQMVVSGDITDIRFKDEARYKKPAGAYWLQALSTKLFGLPPYTDIWTYRVPSLLAVILAVLLLARFGSRIVPPKTAILAAVLMALTLTVMTEARLARADAVLLPCVVLAQLVLLRAYLRDEAALPLGYVIKFWLALGLGILVKGPVILMVSGITIIALAVADKQAAWLKKLKWQQGWLITAVTVLPWLAAITVRSEGAFLSESVGHDFIGKLFEGQDRGYVPPGVHTLIAVGVLWPASLFVLGALPTIWRERTTALFRFCIAWVVPYWILLELIPTKLPNYVIPLLPGLALATAQVMMTRTLKVGRWEPFVFGLWIAASCVCAGVLVMLAYIDAPDVRFQAVILAAVIVCLAVLAVKFYAADALRSLIACALAALAFSQGLFGWALPNLQSSWIAARVVVAAREHRICDNARILTSGYFEPSLVFSYDNEVRAMHPGTVPQEFTYDKCALLLLKACEVPYLAKMEDTWRDVLLLNGYNYNTGKMGEYVLVRHDAATWQALQAQREFYALRGITSKPPVPFEPCE